VCLQGAGSAASVLQKPRALSLPAGIVSSSFDGTYLLLRHSRHTRWENRAIHLAGISAFAQSGENLVTFPRW
jgi:hypothetical protein